MILLILKYLAAAVAMGIGAIGSGIGVGYTASEALEGIARQPNKNKDLMTHMLVGQVMSETPGIFALFVAVLLIFTNMGDGSLAYAFGCLGAGFAAGLSGLGAGYGIGFVSAKACLGLARNTETSGKMLINMILGQALATTPSIFGLVIALMLIFLSPDAHGIEVYTKSAAVLSAGICVGLSSIGPGLGIGYAGGMACDAYSRNMEQSGPIIRTMFVGASVAGSTNIYGFVVAAILIFLV